MHLAGNSKSKIPPTFHQLHKDMRIRPSPWRERVEDMTSKRHSGRYASMSEERSKTCTSLILTFIFKCLTDDFWQNCNDRSLYPVLYLFDCKPWFTNMFFIILCGLQSRALTFFFLSLSNLKSLDVAQSFLGYFLLNKLSFRIIFLLLSITCTLHHRRDYDAQKAIAAAKHHCQGCQLNEKRDCTRKYLRGFGHVRLIIKGGLH